MVDWCPVWMVDMLSRRRSVGIVLMRSRWPEPLCLPAYISQQLQVSCCTASLWGGATSAAGALNRSVVGATAVPWCHQVFHNGAAILNDKMQRCEQLDAVLFVACLSGWLAVVWCGNIWLCVLLWGRGHTCHLFVTSKPSRIFVDISMSLRRHESICPVQALC